MATDRSASLIKIDVQLGESPFGVVHRRLAPAFNLVVLWVIVRHGTASQNCSAMRRLLPFSADLILFFRAQHTGIKGEVSFDVLWMEKSGSYGFEAFQQLRLTCCSYYPRSGAGDMSESLLKKEDDGGEAMLH
uniref:Uncharacterized protein n=1 Tax=Solanum tuberosum TaxID=4113 RepID=M1DCM8_SOLTU